MDRDRFQDADLADRGAGEIEETPGTTGDVRRDRGRRHIGWRLPTALPGALGAVLLVGAIAFGATTIGPLRLTGDTTPVTCQDEQGNTIPCDTPSPTSGDQTGGGSGGDGVGDHGGTGTGHEPGATPTTEPTDGPGDEPTGEPTDKPEPTAHPEPTHEPEPTREPEPTSTPRPETLGLTLSNVDAGVKVDWTTCGADGFSAYKVVRSSDSSVTWPLGEHDVLVVVVENQGTTAIVDGDAPSGHKVWYRVFCVHHTGDGYVVLNSSPARSIETPAEPAPSPSAIDLSAGPADGGVALHWDACAPDGYHWTKVVRSHGDNPSYLPLTDGSQLVAVFEDASITDATDSSVESGQTWFYRVQVIGYWHDQKVVLCQSAAIEVTIP